MTPRRGRPLGVIARSVLEVVRREPATVFTLASQLQLSYRSAVKTVNRLQVGGYVQYGDTVPGRHDRPARVVQPAGAGASSCSFPLQFPFVRVR